MFIVNSCQWLDLNSGPLVSETTALWTLPLPISKYYFIIFDVIDGDKKFCNIDPGKTMKQKNRENDFLRNFDVRLWRHDNNKIYYKPIFLSLNESLFSLPRSRLPSIVFHIY